MKVRKGEIVTILAFTTLVVIGLSTIISTIFLKSKNNKATTFSKARTSDGPPCTYCDGPICKLDEKKYGDGIPADEGGTKRCSDTGCADDSCNKTQEPTPTLSPLAEEKKCVLPGPNNSCSPDYPELYGGEKYGSFFCCKPSSATAQTPTNEPKECIDDRCGNMVYSWKTVNKSTGESLYYEGSGCSGPRIRDFGKYCLGNDISIPTPTPDNRTKYEECLKTYVTTYCLETYPPGLYPTSTPNPKNLTLTPTQAVRMKTCGWDKVKNIGIGSDCDKCSLEDNNWIDRSGCDNYYNDRPTQKNLPYPEDNRINLEKCLNELDKSKMTAAQCSDLYPYKYPGFTPTPIVPTKPIISNKSEEICLCVGDCKNCEGKKQYAGALIDAGSYSRASTNGSKNKYGGDPWATLNSSTIVICDAITPTKPCEKPYYNELSDKNSLSSVYKIGYIKIPGQKQYACAQTDENENSSAYTICLPLP